jgi:hypothetical protein
MTAADELIVACVYCATEIPNYSVARLDGNGGAVCTDCAFGDEIEGWPETAEGAA